jgi:hypothetical protein
MQTSLPPTKLNGGDVCRTRVDGNGNKILKPASEYLMHEYGHYLRSRRYGFMGYTIGGINSFFHPNENDEHAWYEGNASNMGHDYFQGKGVDLTGWQDYWPGSADLQNYQWFMSIADFPFGRFNWWMNP